VKTQNGVRRAEGFEGIGAETEIMEEAFQLKAGEISKMIKSGDNYFILKVIKKTKERVPELEEVSLEVEKDFAEHKAREKALQVAEQVLDALRENPDNADAIAAESNLTWKTLDPVSRSAGIVPEVGGGPQVAEMLASISKTDPLYPKPMEMPKGFAVIRLTDVKKPSDERYEQELTSLKKWVVEVRKTEFLKGWLKVLSEKAEIDINDKYL
jgi:peptidyl-prolyl cis-trans isomerase D